jgi:hypothetical protein
VKPRRLGWAGHVAEMRETNNAYRIMVEKPIVKDHLEDQERSRRIPLRWMFWK